MKTDQKGTGKEKGDRQGKRGHSGRPPPNILVYSACNDITKDYLSSLFAFLQSLICHNKYA